MFIVIHGALFYRLTFRRERIHTNTHTHTRTRTSQVYRISDAVPMMRFDLEPARHLNFRQHRHPRNYVGWQAVHSNKRFYLPFIWRMENHYVFGATYLFQHARQHCKFVSATKSLTFNCFAIIHTVRAFYSHISNEVSCDFVILPVHWSAWIYLHTHRDGKIYFNFIQCNNSVYDSFEMFEVYRNSLNLLKKYKQKYFFSERK